MQNWFANNHVQEFTVSFSLKKFGSGIDLSGLLNNADCLEKSTFEISAKMVRLYYYYNSINITYYIH